MDLSNLSNRFFEPQRFFKELRLYKISKEIYRRVFVHTGTNVFKQNEDQQELEVQDRLKNDPGFARIVFVGALLFTLESLTKGNSLNLQTLNKLCEQVDCEAPEKMLPSLGIKETEVMAQFGKARKILAHILYLWEIATILERFNALGINVEAMTCVKPKKDE